MMDDNFTDSAAFYYICDMTPPRPLHDGDMAGQGLPGFYPNNVDSFPQGSQMCQPSNAQLDQIGDRSENITPNPGHLSGEALPNVRTQWETVPRSCEGGQYQEQWGVPQLVQSPHTAESWESHREREQLEVTRGSLLSRGVHLNNVQNFPSGSNHLNNLNSSAALLNPVNVDSRVNALSTSRKITLTSMHNQSMKPALPLKKIPGIGLHLNSVVSSFRGNSVQDARPNELQVRQNMGGPKPVSIIRNHNLPEKMEMNPISFNVADYALAINAVSPQQQQLKESAQPNPQNISSTPSRKRNFFSEQTDSNEQLYQSSPNALGQMSGEGCKRCNCVRTKCLKLYCDCFAAGLCCTGPCACQGCYNKPEYEDKITEARRQIEYRNPIAFAPKVLQKDEELTPSTPSSSARHRRGCNCKKSMCTKKYCECYKEGVGCSEGCRCEGCQNGYGRKEDHGSSEDVARRRVSHGKEALGSKPLPTPYHPSPGSDLTVLSSSAKIIPTSPSHSSSDKRKERPESSSPCYEPITVCESMKKKNPPSQSYEQAIALYDPNHLANVPSSVAASASEIKNCIGSSSSIRWQRSSLVTQIVPIGEQGFNSHEVFEKLKDAPAEILKESLPVNPADVHSPIRKRVRLQDLCSNSPVEFTNKEASTIARPLLKLSG